MGLSRIFIFVFIALLSTFLTWRIRNYAIKHQMLDIPGSRSSHNFPTPRGGGLAISVCCLVATLFFGIGGILESRLFWAFLGGGSAIAIIGWLDDRKSITPMVRFLVQLAAATWAVLLIGGFPSMNLGVGIISLGWFGSILAILGIVWLTNLYNFMDGIDGIAGTEAVTVGGIGGALLVMSNTWGLALVSWAIAASSLGFLVWNWPPAKIFMGDVGSGFLGFFFAVLLLASERSGAIPLLAWLLLLGVFIGDATFTLFRRLLKREKVWEAHRNHFHQRAVQIGYSHRTVTLVVASLNAVLGFLAILAYLNPRLLSSFIMLGIAMLILLGFWVTRLEHKYIK
ncbi:MAG: glycosyltransferase family 4 protein [Thermodesulfobacteriota bacterium]